VPDGLRRTVERFLEVERRRSRAVDAAEADPQAIRFSSTEVACRLHAAVVYSFRAGQLAGIFRCEEHPVRDVLRRPAFSSGHSDFGNVIRIHHHHSGE
jgi:hypothetical protein